MMTPQGGGVYKCELRAHHVAGNTERIGLSNADNTTSWTAIGTETGNVRVVHGFDLGLPSGATATIQQRVLDWGDARGTGVKWTQATAAAQPLLGRDSRGWFVQCAGTRYLTADSLAAGFSGLNIANTMLAAVDNLSTLTGTRDVFSLGHSASGVLYHDVSAPYSLTVRHAVRRNDGVGLASATYTAAPVTAMAVAGSIDALTLEAQAHGVVPATDSVAALGAVTFDRLTIGALRRSAVTGYLIGRVRQAAVSTPGTRWPSAVVADALGRLATQYGY
jgi:hypothetical protein